MNPVEMRIQSAQGLVRALAIKAYSRAPQGVSLDDLIGYGQLGLAEAANNYTDDSSAHFVTFAYRRIRGAIYDGMAQMTGWSRSQQRKIKYQEAAAEEMEQRARESGSVESETLAQQCEWLAETARRLATVRLASEISETGDISVDYRQGRPDERAEEGEVLAKLRAAIDELPDPEVTVVKSFYFEGVTLTEVAKQHGKDKSWASRVHSRAIAKLSASLRSAVGEESVCC